MAAKEEIEHKFLIDPARLPPLPPGARLKQGYLGFSPTVRVRTEEQPDGARQGYLTIKGEGLVGRDEWEYPIPFEEAEGLLRLAVVPVVSKTRHLLPVDGDPALKWEIDVFEGENEGLIVAEIEIPVRGHAFQRPEWVVRDVTEDRRYKNTALAQRPFRSWGSAG